jgi:hypothetical protein
MKKPSLVAMLGIGFLAMPIIAISTSQNNWVSDQSGCQLLWPVELEPGTSLRWRGQCVNGKANGNGTVDVYKDGRRNFYWDYTGKNGVTWKQGEIQVTANINEIRSNMVECKPDYRSAISIVPDEWELGNGLITKRILLELRDFANKRCPLRRFSGGTLNTNLYIFRASHPPATNLPAYKIAGASAVSCGFAGDPNGPLKCNGGWSSSKAWTDLAAKVDATISTEETRIQGEEEKRRAAVRKTSEENAKSEKRKKFNDFSSKYGNIQWVATDKLMANPFIYQNKSIGLVTRFVQMQSATTGIFEDRGILVISDIPKGMFSQETPVLIIGRVIGNTDLQLPIVGKQKVPHLRFVGVYKCKHHACRDIIP